MNNLVKKLPCGNPRVAPLARLSPALRSASLLLFCGALVSARVQAASVTNFPVLQAQAASQIAVQYNPSTGQKLLRFTTIIANVGQGPLELVPINSATNDTTLAYQVLYGLDQNGNQTVVSSNYVGTFYYTSYVNAWYFTDFTLHELCRVNADGSVGSPVVPSTMKVSCCITDDTNLFPDLPDEGRQTYINCADSTRKGLSVGWGDIYGWHGSGQTLDVSQLADGDYWLVNVADPNHVLLQGPGPSTNSTSAVKIHLAADLVWCDDALPPGAVAGGDGGDSWQWISSNPAPYSGTLCHQSAIATGQHDQYFTNASPTLSVATNNSVISYVYLDPAHPPTEVMLQWNDGATWNHRAYWGADSIALGTNGGPSRLNAGPLPPLGQWVRLQVPASQLALEGASVRGVTFSLFNGRAAWDYTGLAVAPANPPPVVTVTAPSAQSTVSGTVTLSAYPSDGNGPGITSVQFQVDGQNVGAPQTASPYTASWDSTAFGNAAHLVTAIVADAAGKQAVSPSVPVLVDNSSTGPVVWIDDWLPAGAVASAEGGDAWIWVTNNPAPYSGRLSHQSVLTNGVHDHAFASATQVLPVAAGDTLFTYIYLEPAHLPTEVMLEWNDGVSAEHRAYWGADSISYGQQGTAGRFFMGGLPAAGQWVKLAVPASSVGLPGLSVEGMGFILDGGRATFDYSGLQSSYTTPTVALSAGTNSAGFIAPASVLLTASPAASGATVAQVQFFQGTTSPASLAVATASPYQTTVTNLAAGSYTFFAVVTDSLGGAATNAISVVIRPPAPLAISGGQFVSAADFQFSYSTDAGVSYAVDSSADFSSWQSKTNLATGPAMSFTDTNAAPARRFYRVRRLPNP